MAIQDLYLEIADRFGWRWAQISPRVTKLIGASDQEWVRLVMDRTTADWVRAMPASQLDVLEVSGRKWTDFGFKSYRSAHFPEYDVCEGPLEGATFDLIIAEQVMEHVLRPNRAAAHMFQMLRPGGSLLITTPFLVLVHQCPVDCYRWTELGLRCLMTEVGFADDQIRTGSWGNRLCVRASYWHVPKYIPWLHSLANDPIYPQVVWALGRKGA